MSLDIGEGVRKISDSYAILDAVQGETEEFTGRCLFGFIFPFHQEGKLNFIIFTFAADDQAFDQACLGIDLVRDHRTGRVENTGGRHHLDSLLVWSFILDGHDDDVIHGNLRFVKDDVIAVGAVIPLGHFGTDCIILAG